MYWSTDGIGGTEVFWVLHNNVYYAITYLGHRSTSPFVGVKGKLPQDAVPRDLRGTPSAVTARFKEAIAVKHDAADGTIIKV